MSTARARVRLGSVVACVLIAGTVAAAEPAATPRAAGATARDAASGAVATARVEGDHVRDFRTFCDGWMRKLAERTTQNARTIAWTKGGAGVVGEYVSYGTDHTCSAKEEPGKVPIGTITYREIKYRKEGVDEAVARNAPETIVEQTDVTEIFRFAKGRWQY